MPKQSHEERLRKQGQKLARANKICSKKGKSRKKWSNSYKMTEYDACLVVESKKIFHKK